MGKYKNNDGEKRDQLIIKKRFTNVPNCKKCKEYNANIRDKHGNFKNAKPIEGN